MTSECPKNNGIVCGSEDKLFPFSLCDAPLSINNIHISFFSLSANVIFNQGLKLSNVILKIIKQALITKVSWSRSDQLHKNCCYNESDTNQGRVLCALKFWSYLFTNTKITSTSCWNGYCIAQRLMNTDWTFFLSQDIKRTFHVLILMN